jgi:PAS domain S-box-containing protein
MGLPALKAIIANWTEQPRRFFRAFRICATALLFLLGILVTLSSHPLATKLQRASYDWLYKLSFLSRPDISRDPIAIVYIDEISQDELKQPRNVPWDRALFARLIDRLRADGAAAVVLDVIFSGASNPESDQVLETALRESGKVIIGVDMASASAQIGDKAKLLQTPVYPEERFAKAAAALGLVHLNADEDFIIREHFHFTPQEDLPSLSWATAQLVNLPVAREQSVAKERWLKYYGGPETIPHLSFYEAIDPEFKKGFFKGKIVFVGARPTTAVLTERRDEFRSQYESWNNRFVFMPAVEVHATSFLNLYRQDWLVRLPPIFDLLLLFAFALFGGAVLPRFTPTRATMVTVLASVSIVVGAVLGFGMNIWVPWLTFVVVQLPLGLLASFLGNSIDWFLQRRKLEREKEQSARRIFEQAALLDKAQDAIVAFDLEGNVSFWNNGAQKAYGWSAQEIRRQKVYDLGKDPAPMQTARKEALHAGEWTGELRHISKSGVELLMHSRWTLDRDENGEPKGFLMINSDVTEQRQLESHLLRSQRMDSLGTLAGGIAHDLNNVLAPIMMGVELIRLKRPDPKTAQLLETIEKSATRGAALVKQVLTFARGAEGEAKIVYVRHLLKEMDKIFAETFPKNINISMEVGPDLEPVLADVTQLHQVFLNLCVNARDAMPNGGKLRIRAERVDSLPASIPTESPDVRHKKYILVRVADSGTGIPPEIAQKIFEPFFTTKEIGKGTGLGLATVATIIRKHNGFLDFTSKIGEGTEFLIYLPATDKEADVNSDASTKTIRRANGELVLIVDDEQLIRATAEEILANVGYSVITASHAEAALEIVAEKRETLQLVLMDRMMPGMDSFEAMKQMRMLQPGLPVICMSGLAPVSREELAQVADEFLPKPFTAEGLVRSIGERIEQRQRAAIKSG